MFRNKILFSGMFVRLCSPGRIRTYDQSLTYILALLRVWTISSPFLIKREGAKRFRLAVFFYKQNTAESTLFRDSL